MAKWIEDPQGRLEVEKVTEELKLPVWKANYKGKFREFWNECWEKIEDGFFKLKKSNEGKEPAIEDKQTAFNKAFGTVEDTVLEGNKFTQMTGKDYGGILNIAGQKEAGKAYWDNNTKKLYICKNNNSDISPNVNNYIPFDSNSLLERLENLIGFKSEGTYQNSFSGNFNELKIFTYQSSSNIESGNQVHVKYTAPSGYEILTATIFWKDNVQINEPIGFDYERGNQDITVVYSTSRSSRSYVLTLFCKKV